MTSTLNHVQMIPPGQMVPHPLNRDFPRKGKEWEEFVADVGARGVQVALMAREVGGELQLIWGHRRQSAALECALAAVPVEVRVLSDLEALELMFVDNLNRRELNALDEARFVSALVAAGRDPEDLAARLKRSLDWVRTRQLVMDLPEEAQQALQLPKDDDRHLHVGTVQLMLGLDATEREMAVQMILHPEFDLRTLSTRQAADAIQEVIVKPRRARTAWDGQREKLAKEWRTALRKQAPAALRDDVQVQVLTWEEAGHARPGRNAEERVPLAETTPAAPEGMLWLHLAARHGMAVRILPEAQDPTRSCAVVDELLVRQAEAALAEHGKQQHWLAGREKVLTEKAKPTPGGDADPVARALAACDGDGEKDFDDSEAPETVIEQRMEHYAMMEIGALKEARHWAWLNSAQGAHELRPDSVPGDRVPDFLRGCTVLTADLVMRTLDWVLSLKHKPVVPGN